MAEQVNSIKKERDLRDEAVARLSLDLERQQRSEVALKKQIDLKTGLMDTNRLEMQRQLSMCNNNNKTTLCARQENKESKMITFDCLQISCRGN